MAKTLFTDAHRVFVEVLTQARKDANLHQAQVAERVGKDQSFISNIERGQRRVDIIEFCALAKAMNVDPVALLASVIEKLPAKLSI